MFSARDDRSSFDPPTDSEVREQLERILSSPEFQAPESSRKMFRFVVIETLEGRSRYLKGLTVAQEVFERGAYFDVQSDPVVRIAAGRLRRDLERYYLVAGGSDRVLITIPKGGYVPSFEYNPNAHVADCPPTSDNPVETTTGRPGLERWWPKRNPTWYLAGVVLAALTMLAVVPHSMTDSDPTRRVPLATTDRPELLVEPFRAITTDPVAARLSQGLTEEIIGKLARFDEIAVVASARTDVGRDEHTQPHYILQGSLRTEGEKVRSIVRLMHSPDGAVIWADQYDADLRTQNEIAIGADLADRIAMAIAQPFGVVFEAEAADIANSDGKREAYSCTLAYYSYRMKLAAEEHEAVKSCLKESVARLPSIATYPALLSLTVLNEVRFPFKLGIETPPGALTQALSLAQQAAELDPRNARAQQALMLANFFDNNLEAALEAGAAAFEINPNDNEVTGEYGLRLAMAGKWDTGCELISHALSRKVGPAGYYEVGMALCAQMRGDLHAAELWARMADLEYNPMHRVVLMSILGSLGKVDKAAEQKDWLDEHFSELMLDLGRQVAIRLHRREDQEIFLAGLRAAGAAVAQPPSSRGNNRA